MWEEENHLPLGAIMLSGHQKATHFTVFVLLIFTPVWVVFRKCQIKTCTGCCLSEVLSLSSIKPDIFYLCFTWVEHKFTQNFLKTDTGLNPRLCRYFFCPSSFQILHTITKLKKVLLWKPFCLSWWNVMLIKNCRSDQILSPFGPLPLRSMHWMCNKI